MDVDEVRADAPGAAAEEGAPMETDDASKSTVTSGAELPW
jgi:hypothetical protein